MDEARGHDGDETRAIEAPAVSLAWARLASIASSAALRDPLDDRPWSSTAAAEQRLLEDLDALLAIEGVHIADEATSFAGADPGDPGRAFAAALVLGALAGDPPAEVAARALFDARPAARAASSRALSMARSPAVGPAVARLLDEGAPAPALAAALEVLAFRRQASFAAAVVLLAHPEAKVGAAAARCLATLPERKAARAVLRRALETAAGDALSLPVAETLLAMGDRAGLVFVRRRLETESEAPSLPDDVRAAYLRLLALAGEASDRELFYRSLEPSPRDAAAVGWFGHADLVDWLVGSLEAAAEARRGRGRVSETTVRSIAFELAAVEALQRITGGPDEAPPGGSARPVETDAAAWRAFWTKARGRFASGRRHRLGRDYTPGATLDELAGEATAQARLDAALELAIASGGGVRI